MRWSILFLVLLSLNAFGQALRSQNYKHLYNPQSPLIQVRTVREVDRWRCFYRITLRDTTQKAANLRLAWDIRNSLSEAEGTPVETDSAFNVKSSPWEATGVINVPLHDSERYLTLALTDPAIAEVFAYYIDLPPNFPERFALTTDEEPLSKRYVALNSDLKTTSTGNVHIAHYEDDFPAAPVAFSESLGKVSRGMRIDSSFSIRSTDEFKATRPGLYLVQGDTNAAEGVAFRAQEDYPRFSKLSNVAEALIYICTSQEYERIRKANGEKKVFDRVILGITKDADRAKKLMRSYFKRVEAANEFFTSYKEGWKTDRGMVYIVFGPADEVFKFSDQEVWRYKRPDFKTEFVFTKSPSLFDPRNYVLVRDEKYRELWYEMIDLWRNARF